MFSLSQLVTSLGYYCVIRCGRKASEALPGFQHPLGDDVRPGPQLSAIGRTSVQEFLESGAFVTLQALSDSCCNHNHAIMLALVSACSGPILQKRCVSSVSKCQSSLPLMSLREHWKRHRVNCCDLPLPARFSGRRGDIPCLQTIFVCMERPSACAEDHR